MNTERGMRKTENEKRNTENEVQAAATLLHRSTHPPIHPAALTTRCGFCAHEFTEEDGEKACGKCAHFGGCRMVMCPRCGYEMPQTPKLIKMLRQWRLRRVEAAR